MRDTIFISHAAPEDNDITRWLSLQLIGLGYKVWSDVIKLKGGEDWWKIIENEIRENSIKFVLVLSSASNQKDGVLKELAVAQKVFKKLGDTNYIVPLHIDSILSYDDVNIELNRYNSINFKASWADGLKQLLERFEEDAVPKTSSNYKHVKSLWDNIFLHNRKCITESETYTSNWFPILELPKELRFHKFKYAITSDTRFDELVYPVVRHKDYIATFAWHYDFIDDMPKTATYNPENTYKVSTEDILSGEYDTRFVDNKTAKHIIVRLLNKAFDSDLRRKPVSVYEMSNKCSYYLDKNVLHKDKFNKVQLVGKQKEKNWHFGISGSVKMFPERCFVINSHIWFTVDGKSLIPEASKQHQARRKQGKNWWNNDWRKKVLAFMHYLADDEESVHLYLGSEEVIRIGINPIEFISPVCYQDPNEENLPSEDYDSESEEIIDVEPEQETPES
ncbi:toll/interleukin-1 receptor domain-containing protein [Draconibacterium sediminis]|uniref:toll/interleukin-1 receptor domain-containing protein n=1 Tax=Draconibacterium sediminis TaxID=1544798 RepID=UPI0026EB380E|nr:toll/interleukin-1 receptor domain-containing protein [Draconibacterium sediminis]